jgi:AcrR family transcriptional regulator
MSGKKRARSYEDKQKQIDRILTYGERLIHENGVKGFSMRMLANKLNMSPGNLYNYFSGELELRTAILERHMFVSKENLEQTIQTYSGSYRELLQTTLRHYLESACNDQGWFHLLFLSQIDDQKDEAILKLQKGMLDPLKQIIEKAIENGELDQKNELYLLPFCYILILGSSAAYRSSSFTELLGEGGWEQLLEFLSEYPFTY